jgi:hypothetical protein
VWYNQLLHARIERNCLQRQHPIRLKIVTTAAPPPATATITIKTTSNDDDDNEQ